MVQSGVGTCCRARDRDSLEETPEVIEKIFTHFAARKTKCIDHPPPLTAPEAQLPASTSLPLS